MPRSLRFRHAVAAALVVACGAWLAAAPPARFLRYSEVELTLGELGDDLPLDLKALPSVGAEDAWSSWIAARDSYIRARLAPGDEDSIVSWLLLGTSFTSQPRAVVDAAAMKDRESALKLGDVINARTTDLVKALGAAGTDERRLFARRFLEGNGFSLATAAGIEDTRDHLLAAIQRVAIEREQARQELEAVAGNNQAEIALRARLFRERGLSLDTPLTASYALERSLAEMQKRGVLKPGSVKRVAIVGGGLDFADEETGFDFYPVQTVQPFAVLDALKRLQLSPAAGAEVVVLDVSPRVIDHITRARAAATTGASYTLTLPLAKGTEWTEGYRDYWRRFGDQLGAAVPASTPATAAALADVRSVRIPPAITQHLSAQDLNIVAERLDGEPFDLIVATNVLNYYELVEQSLALVNIEAMLKPGGFLLSNTVVPELESILIEPLDSLTTESAGGESDRIIWYRRLDGVAKPAPRKP